MTSLLSDGIDVALVGSETSIYVYAQGSSDPVINCTTNPNRRNISSSAKKGRSILHGISLKAKRFLVNVKAACRKW